MIKPASILLALVLLASCGRGAADALSRANEAWQAGDYEAAVEEYERYLEENPSGGAADQARLQLANINFLNLRRYDRARVWYKEFLDNAPLHPEAPDARERLAESLSETGRSYEAIAEYENLNPPDQAERRRVRLRIADLYYDQKNYSQALTEYEKVIEGVGYDQLCEQAYLRQAAVYHLGRSQFDQAIAAYEKITANTDDPEVKRRAIFGMSDCYAGLFQFDRAMQLLRNLEDSKDQSYINDRIAQLEDQKREMSRVPEIKWTKKRTVEEAEAARVNGSIGPKQGEKKSDGPVRKETEPSVKPPGD
jgi:tetratricopeptide (TPR) repeat protein